MTDVTQAPELLPCPFCGGDAEWSKGSYGGGTDWDYLSCSGCESMGPHILQSELSAVDENYNRQKIIAAWNTRTETAKDVRIAELEAALQKCADPHRYHAPCPHCCQEIRECGSYIARAALSREGEV